VSRRRGLVRHQLFISRELSERLAALAARPGVTRSSILAEALDAWLSRKGISELQERFGPRLDVMTRALARIERNSQIEIEILALLAEGDDAGRAQGRERFEWFTMKVAEAFRAGRGSFGTGSES
jgi:hypothetical protein